MKLRIVLSKILAALLIIVVSGTASAQQVPALSTQAQGIKRKIDQLAPHAHISVIPLRGEERYGEYLSHDEESFTFHDVDLKADITCKYAEVRKVKNGYGGYNSVRGRHTDRTKGLIVAVVVLGGLGALLGAAAAAKD